MSNVSNMFSNASAVQSFRSGGYGAADFDIAVAPLKYTIDEQGYSGTAPQRCYTSTKSVIYRTDNGVELGVHGHGYKPVAPKHMIDNARNILERSDLNTDNMIEQIRTSHEGARCFVQYDLPAHTYETCDGDTAKLSLLCTTSSDGTWPFMISVAAVQSACTNLQVFISGGVAIYKAKHTQSLDIEHGANIIVKSLDVFNNERELWKQWQGTQCSDLQAFTFFATALKCKTALSLIHEGASSPDSILQDLPRRNNNLAYIWRVFNTIYSKRLGQNFWAVYNALTDWSTHFEAPRATSMANIASIQNDRQQVIREAVSRNAIMRAA